MTPSAKVVLVTVTPEVAELWLRRNVHNRRLRPREYLGYARDMQRGAWQLTGDTIKFDKDGVLLDGQHRLTGVVSSGCTVDMWVAYGVDASARDVIDTGIGHTTADALSLRGEKNAHTISSIGRMAIRYERGFGEKLILSTRKVTHSEVISWAEENPDCQCAANIATRSPRLKAPLAVVGYAAWRCLRIDYAEAEHFFAAAGDGVSLDRGDPILAMKNCIDNAATSTVKAQPSPVAYLSLIFRAWNAKRRGHLMLAGRLYGPGGKIIPPVEPR